MTAAFTRILSVIFFSMASTFALAQEKNMATELSSNAVASVNGQSISEWLVQSVGEQLQANGEQADRAMIIDELINLEVLTQAAETNNLMENPEIAATLRLQYTQTLANAYLASKSEDFSFTDDELKALYDEQASQVDQSEFRPSHILVESDSIAQDLLQRLNEGESFESLARDHSLDPGGEQGGDLGWVQGSALPPQLMRVLSTLEVGETHQAPVESDYGFHIVKLVDARQAALPDFQAVKQGLTNLAMRRALAEHVQTLRDQADVTTQ